MVNSACLLSNERSAAVAVQIDHSGNRCVHYEYDLIIAILYIDPDGLSNTKLYNFPDRLLFPLVRSGCG